MAGPWLKYRGHLENISGNLFAGVINAFTEADGTGKDPLDGETKPFPDIAKHLHEAGVAWVAVGDENYGEGSSREHAAMEPRFRGGQGDPRPQLRPHPRDQPQEAGRPAAHLRRPGHLRPDRARTTSCRSSGLADLAPGQPVYCEIVKPDGTTVDFEANHTMNDEQIDWFKAGGALNIIRARAH